jgi:hypothetical protein
MSPRVFGPNSTGRPGKRAGMTHPGVCGSATVAHRGFGTQRGLAAPEERRAVLTSISSDTHALANCGRRPSLSAFVSQRVAA